MTPGEPIGTKWDIMGKHGMSNKNRGFRPKSVDKIVASSVIVEKKSEFLFCFICTQMPCGLSRANTERKIGMRDEAPDGL